MTKVNKIYLLKYALTRLQQEALKKLEVTKSDIEKMIKKQQKSFKLNQW